MRYLKQSGGRGHAWTSQVFLYSSSQQGVVQSVTMVITESTSPMKHRDMMLMRYFQNGSRSTQEYTKLSRDLRSCLTLSVYSGEFSAKMQLVVVLIERNSENLGRWTALPYRPVIPEARKQPAMERALNRRWMNT